MPHFKNPQGGKSRYKTEEANIIWIKIESVTIHGLGPIFYLLFMVH